MVMTSPGTRWRHASGESARSRMVGKNAEGDFASRNDYADVYVRRAGAWRAVSAHVVPVSE